MDIFYNYQNFPQEGQELALAIGTFDGLHKGHRELIANVVNKAQQSGLTSTVLTFHPHPATLSGSTFPLLMPLAKRLEALASLGVQCTLVQELSPDFTALSPEEFIQKVLLSIGVKYVAVGRDFSFGQKRSGNFIVLKSIAEKYNISAHLIGNVLAEDGRDISSSQIRELLKSGRLQEANNFLGYNYTLSGPVVKGAQRGRKLGYPTANIATKQLLPLAGVYGGFLNLNNSRYLAAVHIGAPTTFGATLPTVEAYLPHYRGGEFYGANVSLELMLYLRGSQKFAGEEEIIAAMQADTKAIADLLL